MSVKLTPGVFVQIRNDRPRVLAFIRWCQEAECYPLRRSGWASGPDFHSAIYPADRETEIRAFLKSAV
jgi:hypothetical protein